MAESMLLDAAPPETTTASSFTALLGLPSNQAMELLHDPESGQSPVIPAIEISQKDLIRYRSPLVFVSNTDLIERASMFSIFGTAAADHHHQGMSNSNSNEDEIKLKKEDTIMINADSQQQQDSSIQDEQKQNLTKRKDREKKIKGSDTKKSKKMENHQQKLKACGKSKDDHGGEKLPYVHVRARRGQATDSHSLAERARREKINARMKLLQEIVPGCAKISGTALVLDEIINHVQSLQRQVEFLSMRLAAVNPRISFNLDGVLAAESGSLTASIYPSTITHEPSMWPELQVNNIVEGQQFLDQNHTQQQHNQHQLWNLDVSQQPVWGRDNNENFVTSPQNSVFSYSSANSVALPPNQLKMEI